MKFRYLGDGETETDITLFGHEFKVGQVTKVVGEHVIRKLLGNATFELVEDAAEIASATSDMIKPFTEKRKPGRPKKVQDNGG